jgi:predicted DNA-binding protein (MmcQ/YjbR family)
MARAKRHAHFPVLEALRAFGLGLPGTHTKAPWPGHLDLAVNDKTFAYLSLDHEPLRVGVKLPFSGALALTMPNVEPTGYGLGKSGWVTATFADGQKPPVALLTQWLEESYRAQAPKTLVKQLDGGAAPARPKATRARRSK